jgi:hypothetical protein
MIRDHLITRNDTTHTAEINGFLVAWVVVGGLIALVFLTLGLAGVALVAHQQCKKTGPTVQLGLPRQTRAFQTMKDEEDPDGPPSQAL